MEDPSPLRVTVPDGPPRRLDKALAAALPAEAGLSRSRLQSLISTGAVADSAGTRQTDPKTKIAGGSFEIDLPPTVPLDVLPEAIPLYVRHEDADLIVVEKPAGMVVHPAPGAHNGTLVNALLYHCGAALSGIGGVGRPGIVHRIDKDTSGLLVVAKSDRAHQGLSQQFADHSVERQYSALVWGAPDAGDPRLVGLPGVSVEPGGVLAISLPLARHPQDRKRMAVARTGGRRAVTRITVAERFGPTHKPVAARLSCALETGRTHQIRVHAKAIGHPLIGDPTYGKARQVLTHQAILDFNRQALHAETLGFVHPISGNRLFFAANAPEDFQNLLTALRHI